MACILLNFLDSLVESVTVGEKGLEPHFFELEVGVHEIIDGILLYFIKFNWVSCLCLAFGVFLVGEIIGIEDTTHASNQVEALSFILWSENFFDWARYKHDGRFDSGTTFDKYCPLSLLSQFWPGPDIAEFLLIEHAKEWGMGKNLIESDIFKGDEGTSDAQQFGVNLSSQRSVVHIINTALVV